MLDAEHARRLDAEDPLAPFRARFDLGDPDLIYLDGNSLGRLPKAAAPLARDLVERQWGERLIRSWNEGWLEANERLGAKIARLVGAHEDEVIVADATSVNLFKLVVAALRYQPGRQKVLSDDLNFPSDLYIIQGALELLGQGHTLELLPSEDSVHGPAEALRAALDEDTALLSLSHTVFKSGYCYDIAELTRAAHAVGALTLWDLSHSVGALEIDLKGANVDLAVGCTYKYLNGGPGAPAFLYVRRDLQDKLANPIPGWMGKQNLFDFALDYAPEGGLRRFLTGTAPVVSLALIEPGVDLLLEAGMKAVREKSVRQTDYLIALWEAHLAPYGFRLASPQDARRRGSHVSLRHERGLGIDLAMIRDQNVVPDFRPPDLIRLGIAPLYTRYIDLHSAVMRIQAIMDEQRYDAYAADAPEVT